MSASKFKNTIELGILSRLGCMIGRMKFVYFSRKISDLAETRRTNSWVQLSRQIIAQLETKKGKFSDVSGRKNL